jgi:hypothetical protein
MSSGSFKRTLVSLTAAAVALLAPAAGVSADGPPGDQSAPRGPRVTLGGGSSRVHTWSHTGGDRFGTTRRGHEEVTWGGGGQAANDDDDNGQEISGPLVCRGSVLSLAPWSERVPGFNIMSAPGTQGGIVNFRSQFWLDGEFDGHAYSRQGQAYVTHFAVYRDPLADINSCVTTVDTFAVRVHYWPVSYTWDYGDGVTPPPTKCGSLFEPPSSCPFEVRQPHDLIQHIYRLSSFGHDSPDDTLHGYLVSVTVVFAMGISEDRDGAPVRPLREVSQQAWLWYPVREVQSVLTQ